MNDDQLRHQHEVWEGWAQADPMWAILSSPDRTNGRWDGDDEEFFASGVAEIRELMTELADRDLTVNPGRCLDFGCGVGRLTQALGDVFTRADGVDISETMITLAREFNRHGEQCEYHVNLADDLSLFGDGQFDLIFSTIVLQHNPPAVAQRYIEEFVRLLAPGGLAVFDMPAGFGTRQLPAGGYRAEITVLDVPDRLDPGQRATVRVEVRNASEHNWPEWVPIRVGNHWRKPSGALVNLDDGRTLLTRQLAPGESESATFEVTAPSAAGSYALEFDLVQDGVCWFADRGSPTSSRTIGVGDPSLAPAGLRGWLRNKLAPSTPADRTGGSGAPDTAPASSDDAPEPYTMNAIPKLEVEAAVRERGGLVVDTRPSMSAGPDWETYRYFVRRT